MKSAEQRKAIKLLAPSALISGLSAYGVLSYLMIPINYIIPISISMSLLSIGLTRYYSNPQEDKVDTPKVGNDESFSLLQDQAKFQNDKTLVQPQGL